MSYVDTSIIVAYYCPEPLSEKAEYFITAHARPAISNLTELELFYSPGTTLCLSQIIRSSFGIDLKFQCARYA